MALSTCYPVSDIGGNMAKSPSSGDFYDKIDDPYYLPDDDSTYIYTIQWYLFANIMPE